MCKSRPFKLFPFTGVLENMNQNNIDYKKICINNLKKIILTLSQSDIIFDS